MTSYFGSTYDHEQVCKPAHVWEIQAATDLEAIMQFTEKLMMLDERSLVAVARLAKQERVVAVLHLKGAS